MDKFDKQDSQWRAIKESNPGASFGKYWTEQDAREMLEDGKARRSLGPRLKDAQGNPLDFWQAGVRKFEQLIKIGQVTPNSRVVEYGCGSLRLGAHFIKFLQPKKFFGLDITDAYYEMGKEIVGADLISEKQPHLAVT